VLVKFRASGEVKNWMGPFGVNVIFSLELASVIFYGLTLVSILIDTLARSAFLLLFCVLLWKDIMLSATFLLYFALL